MKNPIIHLFVIGLLIGACCNNVWAGTNGRFARWVFKLPVQTGLKFDNAPFFSNSPNPTNDALMIDMGDTQNLDDMLAHITDIAGRTVFQGNIKAKQLNVSNLQPGIYFLTLKIKDKMGMTKFVKN
jgi:Secretion system C-terminal sorting domain